MGEGHGWQRPWANPGLECHTGSVGSEGQSFTDLSSSPLGSEHLYHFPPSYSLSTTLLAKEQEQCGANCDTRHPPPPAGLPLPTHCPNAPQSTDTQGLMKSLLSSCRLRFALSDCVCVSKSPRHLIPCEFCECESMFVCLCEGRGYIFLFPRLKQSI